MTPELTLLKALVDKLDNSFIANTQAVYWREELDAARKHLQCTGWQPMSTVPTGEEILVRGGTWEGEVGDWRGNLVAHVKCKFKDNKYIYEVCNTDYYEVYISNPEAWVAIPDA